MNLFELLNLDRPLILFDAETTGQNPHQDRICGFAFILLTPETQTIREWETLINPGMPIPHEATYGNPEKAFEGHGITDEMVAGAPLFSDLAPHLLKGFKPGTDYGGYNLKHYDLPLVKTEFKRAGIDWDYQDARILDGFRLWQVGEKRRLSDAVERFCRRKHEGAHNHLMDIRASLDVIIAQLQEFKQLPREMAALHDLQWPKDPNEVPGTNGQLVWKNDVMHMNFGKKWKGMRLDLMSRRDLEWIDSPACQGATTETKRVCREAWNGRFPKREVKSES